MNILISLVLIHDSPYKIVRSVSLIDGLFRCKLQAFPESTSCENPHLSPAEPRHFGGLETGVSRLTLGPRDDFTSETEGLRRDKHLSRIQKSVRERPPLRSFAAPLRSLAS